MEKKKSDIQAETQTKTILVQEKMSTYSILQNVLDEYCWVIKETYPRGFIKNDYDEQLSKYNIERQNLFDIKGKKRAYLTKKIIVEIEDIIKICARSMISAKFYKNDSNFQHLVDKYKEDDELEAKKQQILDLIQTDIEKMSGLTNGRGVD